MPNVAILGLGLMGGSLGLALQRPPRRPGRVIGYARRPAVRAAAQAQGICDEIANTPPEAVAGADLIVLCAPIRALPELAAACAPALKPGAIVTDVGSTKAWLNARLPAALGRSDVTYLGSHPICGSEQSGIEAARANLYDDAVVVVTPTTDAPEAVTAAVQALWESAGARVRVLDAATHDRMLARTSHLPHLAAAALAATVGREQPAAVSPWCGTGFWSTSRLAEGAPEIWRDILLTNAPAIADELDAFAEALRAWQTLLRNPAGEALESALAAARAARRTLAAGGPS
ncbi:MAG: prephenate dehydrogenase/arogenate dehydrogenase family protein [Candidatus Marinimicrobia bacterium]|nr:prephenate dehydrogenase/arogenate dehydrogenase family protein [Candidatus Neomarinimicrobiota bacterium]